MSDGLVIEWLGGNCPVQSEGTFDGQPFYFRARGSQVTCDVGTDAAWSWYGPIYEWPDAGWISEGLARAFIREAYIQWKGPSHRPATLRRRNGLEDEFFHALRFSILAEKELGDLAKPVSEWAMRYAQRIKDRQGESA